MTSRTGRSSYCYTQIPQPEFQASMRKVVRLRFLREARAAAKVRHSNVASVFHLGRISQGYFYAMEFVDGETLESFIVRSGPLEVKIIDLGLAKTVGDSASESPISLFGGFADTPEFASPEQFREWDSIFVRIYISLG
jgi:serine/threonine protein kinase